MSAPTLDHPTTPPADPLASSGLESGRVLIIDDTRAIHDDFHKILGRNHEVAFDNVGAELFNREASYVPQATFTLDSAYQGNEGLSLAQCATEAGRPFSMAFVDVRMPPGWDGIETASRLWAVDPDLQIVICTAYSDYSWQEIVKRLGNRDSLVILKKPFDPIEVLQLAHALTKKWLLTKKAQLRVAELETRVNERTRELRKVNQELQEDIVQRQQAETRLEAFSKLSHRLSAAQTARDAGDIIVNVADRLLGWDACNFDLYSPEDGKLHQVLTIDTIEGQRSPIAHIKNGRVPSVLSRRAMQEGAQLILKEKPDMPAPGGVLFGDRGRPSASIMIVPVRDGSRVIGLLSIHSYTLNAYDPQSLETFQRLADHCAGALDRIRTEEAFNSVREHLNHLLRESPAVIYSFNTDGKITTPSWISENVIHLIGYSSLECGLSDWWASRVHPSDWDRVSKGRAQHSGEREIILEYRLRHKNGNYRWIRDQSRRVSDTDGGGVEVIGTWMDVTIQKELEDQLRQAQKMEAVGQLAGGVAHDFNNLLTVILGNTELVLMGARTGLSDQNVECLKQVTAASQRASNLTRQLLAFSRKQILHTRPVNLNNVIGNLTKMLNRIIGEDIELQCTYAPSLPLVQADIGMMEQVVVNFVVNSRDAMPEGGKLKINTAKCSFSGSCPEHPEARAGDFVSLSVTDTGTGIALEHLPHLFEPFFTTKEIGKGTGLGLATVDGIVKQHQGWIEVASQLTVETTFRIFLPVFYGPAPREKIKAIEAIPLGGTENILLVEDDEAVRTLTCQMLEKFGYRVEVAASGREAVELWRNRLSDFDLLLSDIIMPHGVTGVELAEQLCAQCPDLKVVFMSGHVGNAVAKMGTSDGPLKHRCLQKPFPTYELIRTVRQCLDGK